jgi:glycosyltransferase involved in cell wall biosynthesis
MNPGDRMDSPGMPPGALEDRLRIAADRLIETPAISIVVPVYNEEETVTPLVELVDRVLTEAKISFELITVDDGSRDRTAERLAGLCAAHDCLRVIRLTRNYGQTPAMQAGIDAARGAVIVMMDGDLQNDPRDIPKLLAKLDEGYDIVSGWRRKRKDNPLLRTFPSRIANWIIGRLSGVRLHDSGCSLKAYRAANLKSVRFYSEMHRFMPAIASISGARVAEVEVEHHPRTAGKSKYGISRVFKVMMDLLVIKMITGFASRPGRYFAFLGLPWFPIGGVFLYFGLTVPRGMGTIVLPAAALLFFFLGFHFLVFSLVGELTLETGNFRPDRVIEELDI